MYLCKNGLVQVVTPGNWLQVHSWNTVGSVPGLTETSKQKLYNLKTVFYLFLSQFNCSLIVCIKFAIWNEGKTWLNFTQFLSSGLLIKEILRLANAGGQYSGMLEQTVGVLFYSVPHRGASLAKISKKAKYMLFPTIEVQELDCGT